MTLWFILFGCIVAVSFVLALRSMADFEENPQEKKDHYGLFLIRNPIALNVSLLDSLHERIIKMGLIISLERLIKGRESALVIFGPKEVLRHFVSVLNLLELEDYTRNLNDQISAWEMGLKSPDKEVIENSFESFPLLEKDEQFWWQIVLLAKEDGGDKYFESQIRAVVLCSDDRRRVKLASILQNSNAGRLIKVPKPFTSLQIFEFYRKRSFFRTKNNLNIKFPVLLPLLQLHLNRRHPKEQSFP